MYGINGCKRLVKDRANDSEHPQYNKAALNAKFPLLGHILCLDTMKCQILVH